jgi:hypothetical protein
MIPVTKPFLPPREEYDKYLDGIWERNWLTNNWNSRFLMPVLLLVFLVGGNKNN